MSSPAQYRCGSYIVITPTGVMHQPTRLFQEPGGPLWLGQPHVAQAKTLCDLYWRDAAEVRLSHGQLEIGVYLLPITSESFRLVRIQYRGTKWLPVDLTLNPESVKEAMEWLLLTDITILACEDLSIDGVPPQLASIMLSRQRKAAPAPEPATQLPVEAPPMPAGAKSKGLTQTDPSNAARPDKEQP